MYSSHSLDKDGLRFTVWFDPTEIQDTGFFSYSYAPTSVQLYATNRE
ncbi:hypothetical protein HMPREF3214_00955 [Alloscardovia omnicolens]|nr:hypothetical protein HMPREF3214_00955 [Alloscardovia omnicolens]